MLSASADYLTQEARLRGAEPRVVITLYDPDGIENDYVVPQADISNDDNFVSAFTTEAPEDFSDLVFPDMQFYLLDPDGYYTPGHANFIFGSDPRYCRRGVRLEIGYLLPGASTTETITLFEGVITDWNVDLLSLDEDGAAEMPIAEIITRSWIAQALDKTLATSHETEGTPQPLVYGSVFRETQQVLDQNPETPDAEADFESGNITGADGYDSLVTAGGGAVAISTGTPCAGTYCALHQVNGANQDAFGLLSLPAPADLIQFTYEMRIEDMPAPGLIEAGCVFMEVLDSGGNRRIYLEVRASSQVRLYVYKGGVWGHRDLDWYLDSYEDTYIRITIAASKADKYVRVIMDNNDIINWEPTAAPYGDYKTLKVGFATDSTPETWSARIDNIQLWDSFYRYFYQFAGSGAWVSIDAIYIDGAVILDYLPEKRSARRRYIKKWVRRYGQKGKRPSDELFTKYEGYGGVAFSVAVNGEILLKATKNTTTHPVDIIEALMTEAGADGFVDAASFVAAKAARTIDRVGVWVEDQAASEAIGEICGATLYRFWESQGKVKLMAYGGAPPASALTISDQDFYEVRFMEETGEIKNYIKATYGWHDKDPHSFILAQDADSIAAYGQRQEDLQLEWGDVVGTGPPYGPGESDIKAMVTALAGLLKDRLCEPRRYLEIIGFLNLARLEPGDRVTLNSAFIPDTTGYEVVKNEIDLGSKECQLTLVKFMGES